MVELRQPFGLKNAFPEQDNAGNRTGIPTEIVGSKVTKRAVLGRADLSATTNTDVYTVPANLSACVKIFMCNRNSTPIAVRLALHNGTVANEDYIYFNYPIGAYETLEVEEVELNAADVVMAYSDTANVTAVVCGMEHA
jgi:hypothetical protein